MDQPAEELLRHITLRNGHITLLPQAVTKLDLSPISLPQPTPVKQHLQAWINECKQIQEAIDLRHRKTAEFDTWYAENCLSKRPPGMTTNGVLSPARRKE
ncbi:LAFA_0B01288g1_1 [Lachancea sp. 'fantastica']|nr:LAFA_0B01288g1_1 [Lachancea sp. 'fantastica']